MNLDELEAKAKAATPGPWIDRRCDSPRQGDRTTTVKTLAIHSYHAYQTVAKTDQQSKHKYEDAAYIAAANPIVVLALIARLRLADALAEAVEALHKRSGCIKCNVNPGVFVCDLAYALAAYQEARKEEASA